MAAGVNYHLTGVLVNARCRDDRDFNVEGWVILHRGQILHDNSEPIHDPEGSLVCPDSKSFAIMETRPRPTV
jgi:hypothetical protein